MIKRCYILIVFFFASSLSAEPLWEPAFYEYNAYIFASLLLNSPVYAREGTSLIPKLQKFITELSSMSNEELELRWAEAEKKKKEKAQRPLLERLDAQEDFLFENESESSLYELSLTHVLNSSFKRFIRFRAEGPASKNKEQMTPYEANALRLVFYLMQAQKEKNDEKVLSILAADFRAPEHEAYAQEVLKLLESWDENVKKISIFALKFALKYEAYLAVREKYEERDQGCCTII